jgi:hypothetical protein
MDDAQTKPAPRRAPRQAEVGKAAVRMTEVRGAEAFPAGDPRAGAFAANTLYRVPEDVPPATAEALVAGGGYEWCERPAPQGE